MSTTPSFPDLRLLVLDVDGTLTDGLIHYHADGSTSRAFHIRDGLGLRLLRQAGFAVGVLTAKAAPEVRARLRDLAIDLLIEGCDDKAAGIDELGAKAGIALAQAAYLGDDLLDLPAMMKVAYPMAVADAPPEVRSRVRYLTTLPGGRGAVRQACEHLLQLTGRRDAALSRYLR
jgi:3-deoxy-D-manno-octulosonate 8-phosphate phosphatase (KDO 8-P phosphatase)